MNKSLKQHVQQSVDVVSKVEQWKVHPIDAQFLHAIMGIVDEAGELNKICKSAMFYAQEIRLVEIMEEFGDLWYYQTLGLMAIARLYHITVEEAFEMVLRVNRAKLETRYPEGEYNRHHALFRNKTAEYAAMIVACNHDNAGNPLPLYDIDTIGKGHTSLTVQTGESL